MPFTLPVAGLLWGVLALIFGIVVILFPRILNYVVGAYLIIAGILAIIAYIK